MHFLYYGKKGKLKFPSQIYCDIITDSREERVQTRQETVIVVQLEKQ